MTNEGRKKLKKAISEFVLISILIIMLFMFLCAIGCTIGKNGLLGFLLGCVICYIIVSVYDFYDNNYCTKELPNRWRANIGEKYYIIGIRGDIVEYKECAEPGVDDLLFAFGNYFQTREKAEKARDLIEECLNKFHEEND